jgi:ABC-type dipeptide/oligopeptide/nickel transport system permease component
MLRFLGWRLLQSVLVLWAVYTVTFFLLMLTPGDPFIAGERKAPQSVREALARKYGLEYLTREDRGKLGAGERMYYISQAYVRYATNLVQRDAQGRWHLDFGPSIEYENWSVGEIIA